MTSKALKRLSREIEQAKQQEAAVLATFIKYDGGGSGIVSVERLAELLHDLGLHAAADQEEAAFTSRLQSTDTDHKIVINFEDFKRIYNAAKKGAADQVEQHIMSNTTKLHEPRLRMKADLDMGSGAAPTALPRARTLRSSPTSVTRTRTRTPSPTRTPRAMQMIRSRKATITTRPFARPASSPVGAIDLVLEETLGRSMQAVIAPAGATSAAAASTAPVDVGTSAGQSPTSLFVSHVGWTPRKPFVSYQIEMPSARHPPTSLFVSHVGWTPRKPFVSYQGTMLE